MNHEYFTSNNLYTSYTSTPNQNNDALFYNPKLMSFAINDVISPTPQFYVRRKLTSMFQPLIG